MSIEFLMGFAIGAAILQLLPGRGKRSLLSYARSGNPSRTLAAAFAVCMSSTIVMMLMLALSGLILGWSAFAAAIFGGFGLSILLLGGMIVWRLRGLAGPIADNDNLPETKPLKTFGKIFLQNLIDRPQALLFAAFASQFAAAGDVFFQQTIVLSETFFAISILAALFYVLAPEWLLQHLRMLESRKIKGRARGCLRVSTGAVTVGYRRLAA